MKFLARIGPKLVMLSLMATLAPGFGLAQPRRRSRLPAANQHEPAAISRVKILVEKGSPTVEIISTRPVIPTITKLKGPLRLVIDLPNASMSMGSKRIDIHSEDISAVRLNQYVMTPPVVRVVVDLLKPHSYTWDAAGNRLRIRLHAEGKEVTAKPPSIPALTKGVQPVAVPVSPVNSGNVVWADRLASGASVSAGTDTTILRLTRGGEIHICPGTTVSVTHSQNGPDLMLGMSTGALETHYALENSDDSIVTPDFRILLRGPGEFHYAISADSRGNTCVRTLPGNTASAIVFELIGDGTLKVKPGQQFVFHSGHLNAPGTALPQRCGCPARAVPVMRASLPSTSVVPEADLPASVHLAQPGDEAMPITPQPAPPPSQVKLSEMAAVPAPRPKEVHVQVDARMVYPAPNRPSAPPAPMAEPRDLPLVRPVRPVSIPTVILPPPSAAQTQARKPHHGAFGRIKGFFTGMFR